MPAKIDRKIIKSGDSQLPPNWVRAFNLKQGDVIELLYDSVVLIKPKDLKLDLEFLKKEFGILEKLAKEGLKRRNE
jgi:bifunctional DNA-binding transcriptional regulator/antitoxin component of YhaV-PrlF toxin-antitoxin module